MTSPLVNGTSFFASAGGAGTLSFGSARPSFLTPAQAVSLEGIVDGQSVTYLAQYPPVNPTQRGYGHGTFHSAGGGSITRDPNEVAINNGVASIGPVNFSAAPMVSFTLLSQDVVSGFIPATGNLSFYVDPTGSDSNPGTITAPFATPQHAANVANTYDWLNLYVPTININAGTYTDNGLSMVVSLPSIRNPGLGAFPTLNFTGTVTFSVAATNGAETINVSGGWQFQGGELINDCFGTAISTAGDLSIENNLAFQATGTITMPAHPSQQGQKISVRTSQTVTTLTIQASAGQALTPGAPTTLLQGHSFSVIWNDQNSKWFFGN